MPLDKSRHIGSAENVRVLMLNIADMAAYIENLEAAISCYEYKKNKKGD